MAKEFKFSDILNQAKKVLPKKGSALRKVHREINLVPDIKNEMIKTLKLRNYIFFICIVVASASVGVTLVFGTIAGGQQAVIDGKNGTIEKLSEKIKSYSDLSDFLTIKDQLGSLADLSENKQVISRTFNVLSALLPSENSPDTIKIAELNVDLSEGNPTLSFEAQANAGQEPYIDYNVVDSFKKSMEYVRYDYGDYVDKNGNTIPAYCMIDTNSDGAIFNDASRGLYALWTIDEEGCNPSNEKPVGPKDDYNGQQVVRIWRTPQFSTWYQENPSSSQPYMSLDGQISNVEHFESACYSYTGDDSQNKLKPTWTESNENCRLVPDGEEGIIIGDDHSNGRDSNGELVVRFSASISIAPEVYKFANHHVIALAPAGRRNVTDSYVQIQNMFNERASDCEKDDTACKNSKNNTNTEGN